jgi:hypothetical protein
MRFLTVRGFFATGAAMPLPPYSAFREINLFREGNERPEGRPSLIPRRQLPENQGAGESHYVARSTRRS